MPYDDHFGFQLVLDIKYHLFEKIKPRGTEDNDLLAAAATRLYEYVLPLALAKWGTRIARIPWTDEETKTFCSCPRRLPPQRIRLSFRLLRRVKCSFLPLLNMALITLRMCS